MPSAWGAQAAGAAQLEGVARLLRLVSRLNSLEHSTRVAPDSTLQPQLPEHSLVPQLPSLTYPPSGFLP